MSSISYYAVIPSWVLSHSKLSASEKLMCALISAMSQKSGYCFATNDALAIALNVTESSVKYVLQKLEASNIIAIHNKKTKKAGNRQIRLVFAERIEEGEDAQEAPELARDEIADAFDRFYEVYPRKEHRIPALKMFKSKKLHKKINDLVAAAKVYAEKKSETDKQFILLPASFLNNQVWEEYVYATEEGKKNSNGAAAPVDPFESFIAKCRVYSDELFNQGGPAKLAAMDKDGSWDMDRFDAKEFSVINTIGFAKVMMHIIEGGFVADEIKPVWKSLG